MRLEEIKNIAVIGIGVMGPDIALGFALAGYQVVGIDIVPEALMAAHRKLYRNLHQMVEGKMIDQARAEEARSNLSFTLEWDSAVAWADYVTEAVPEVMETKREVFRRCGEICGPEVIVASNTSSMSITQISSKMKNPQRAISTHWTIPAHLSPMVEVIRGERTSDAADELVFDLLSKAGKVPVRCKDNPGFIHNYVQFAMVKAALNLVEAGWARPEDVDAVVRNGFGLRLSSVGPVEFVDMCGLETILNIQKYMYDKTQDPVYKPSQAIAEKVEQGDLGVKSGKGFYDYSAGQGDGFWEQTNRNIIRVLRAMKQE